ncbi:hypothetical protein [Microvirga terricola]|uniref:Uncharacterized protein n=1 Tax=Microvirga terricola TaxID=2719797 RepID=A0ABX0V762_9HYPH|nr:hypothetical protein [Microvirga terricola]NIX75683.1 hypothetical protein [Microvirga terricola]
MHPRFAFSGLFGLALIASLALKLPGNVDIAVAEPNVVPRDVASLLEQRGFQVRQNTSDYDLLWVEGNIGEECRVLIAPIAPQGWHQALVTGMAEGNQLFYFFEGQMYSEQPILRTRAHYYWRKLNRYLGLSAPDRPVLAAIATPNCESLPLNDLAMLTDR